jgi:hypothetical protein
MVHESLAPQQKLISATQLYALAIGAQCAGQERCHWCNAPCNRMWFHDEPPPVIGVKRQRLARCTQSPWICVGCWLFRRKRTTVRFLRDAKTYKDGQSAERYSWWVTDKETRAVAKEDHPTLLEMLKKPPHCFALSLLEGANQTVNHFHLAPVNQHKEILADTRLGFTINAVVHFYTVYELEEALKKGPEGKEPGVQALFRILGLKKPVEAEESEEEKRGRGRPPALPTGQETVKKVIQPPEEKRRK